MLSRFSPRTTGLKQNGHLGPALDARKDAGICRESRFWGDGRWSLVMHTSESSAAQPLPEFLCAVSGGRKSSLPLCFAYLASKVHAKRESLWGRLAHQLLFSLPPAWRDS